jgi:hypothetical protein
MHTMSDVRGTTPLCIERKCNCQRYDSTHQGEGGNLSGNLVTDEVDIHHTSEASHVA